MPCTQYVLSGPTYHFHHAFITEVQGCWWGRWLSPALLPFVSLTSTPELHFCKQRKQASSWGGVKLSVTFWNGASLKIKGAQWRGWICTFHFLFYLNVLLGFFAVGHFLKVSIKFVTVSLLFFVLSLHCGQWTLRCLTRGLLSCCGAWAR